MKVFAVSHLRTEYALHTEYALPQSEALRDLVPEHLYAEARSAVARMRRDYAVAIII